MAAPTFDWTYDLDRSGPDGILWKVYASLTMTTDTSGSFASGGETLPSITEVGLQRIIHYNFQDAVVDLGDTSNTLAIPVLDTSDPAKPKLLLRDPTDGSERTYDGSATKLVSANVTFKLMLIGDMA